MKMSSPAYVLHQMQNHLCTGLLAVSTLLLIRCCLAIKHCWTFLKANCWFCNNDCLIRRKDSDWWECKNCKQYNGFNEDGDYLYPIKAMYKWDSTSMKQGSIPETTLLCKLCNVKQEKKIRELACFQPSHEEHFDLESEQFELFLAEKYKLCSTCDTNVIEELARQDKHFWEKIPTQNQVKGQKTEGHLSSMNTRYFGWAADIWHLFSLLMILVIFHSEMRYQVIIAPVFATSNICLMLSYLLTTKAIKWSLVFCCFLWITLSAIIVMACPSSDLCVDKWIVTMLIGMTDFLFVSRRIISNIQAHVNKSKYTNERKSELKTVRNGKTQKKIIHNKLSDKVNAKMPQQQHNSICDSYVTHVIQQTSLPCHTVMPDEATLRISPEDGLSGLALNSYVDTGDDIIDNKEHNVKQSVITNSLVTPDLLHDHLGSMYIQERLKNESKKSQEKHRSANFLNGLHGSTFNNNCADSYNSCSLQSNIKTGNDCDISRTNTWKAFARQHTGLPEPVTTLQTPLLKPATLNIQHFTRRQPTMFSNVSLSSHNGAFSAQCHQNPFITLDNAHKQSITNRRDSFLFNDINNVGHCCTLLCSEKSLTCLQSTPNEAFLRYRSSSENKKENNQFSDEEEEWYGTFQPGRLPTPPSTNSSRKAPKTKHTIKQQKFVFRHAERSYNLYLCLCACLLISMLVNAYYVILK